MTTSEHRKHFAEEGTSGNTDSTKRNRNVTTKGRTSPRKSKYQTFKCIQKSIMALKSESTDHAQQST